VVDRLHERQAHLGADPADHGSTLVGVGGVGAVRHAHAVQEVADALGQRIAARGDDPHGLDLGRGDGGGQRVNASTTSPSGSRDSLTNIAT
jgi:hypothetical protein